MRFPRRIIAVVIAIVATASLTSAQPTETDKEHALALFKASDQQYKRGEFEKAAELLREAYSLFPEPILLYNLARALEGSGDAVGAIDHYERFLAAAPAIEDRGAIERRVATLKAELARRDAAAVVATRTPLPIVERDGTRNATSDGMQAGSPSSPDATNGAASLDAPVRPRVLPWVIVGTGVVALAAGGTFGYLSRARHDDAVDEPVQAEAARLQDQAHRFATIANVALIGGGVLVVGGAVWTVIDRRRRRGATATAIKTGVRLEVGPSWIGVAGVFR